MATKAQRKASHKYNGKALQDGRAKMVTMQLTAADAAQWDAYAAALKLPRATMIRRAVAASMATDGWIPPKLSSVAPLTPTATPEAVTVSVSAPDARTDSEDNQPRQPRPAEGKRRPGRPKGSGKKDAQTIIAAADNPGQLAALPALGIPADMPPESSAPSPAPAPVQVSFLPDLPDPATRRR